MRSRVAVVGVLVTIVALLLWNLVIFAPKGRSLSDARDKTKAANAIEVQERNQLARLNEISKNGPEIEAQLGRLNAAVPVNPDLDGFIVSANQIAVESGIDWLSVSPGVPTSAGGGPSVISLSMQIQGGFFQVLDYFNRLERMGRLVIVDGVNLAAGAASDSGSGSTTATVATNGSPTLAATVTARMFTQAAPAGTAGSAPTSGPTGSTAGNTPAASGNGNSSGETSTTAQVN